MGIKNLLKFLNSYDNIVNEINYDDFKGEKVAIDISIILYQVIIAIRNSGADLMNQKGEITSHILGLFNKTINLLRKNIIPIYVFDGKPPAFKQKILDARRDVKKRAYMKLFDITDEKEKIKYFKRTVRITKKQIDECKELLNLMGIPYIEAPEEADSQCAYLVKAGIAQSVITEDMDILTFGANKIYRNLTSYKKTTLEIKLDNILEKVDLTYDQFIEFCILLGCDYCDRVKDIKQDVIYEYYYKYKNIPETLNAIEADNIRVPNLDDYKKYKDYFKNAPVIEIDTQLERTKPDITKLTNILVNEYGLIKAKLLPKLKFLELNKIN